jgi:signal transduction histidine kinase
MLHDFLTSNRSELIERCRLKVASRRAPRATPAELEHGVPLFLDQLTAMLARGERQEDLDQRSHGRKAASGEAQLEDSARKHGNELLRNQFTIDQVVHDYGDLCQSITEVAHEQGVPISVQDFGVLNITLDNAIGSAVTEFARQGEVRRVEESALATNERLGVLAHEMRNNLNTAILAIAAMKAGSVGFGGATAGALDRSLIRMRTLIDRTLAEVRLEEGVAESSLEVIELASFIREVLVAAGLEASHRGCELTVEPVEQDIHVEADRHILAAAVANLLQNACKFTHAGSLVVLRAFASGDRVLMEIEDRCGGLAEGVDTQIFKPFEQRGGDRSGVGLGLSISRKGVEASGGTLHVRNMPGCGCVFTIDLPRKLLSSRPALVASAGRTRVA